MLIDAHNHLGPDIPLLGDCRMAHELVGTMDRAGVAMALVQQHVRDTGYIHLLEAGFGQVVPPSRAHPTRLFGCALVHPLLEDLLALARKGLPRRLPSRENLAWGRLSANTIADGRGHDAL